MIFSNPKSRFASVKFLIRIFRVFLWRVLGFKYDAIPRKNINLRALSWVTIGHRSYDNGAKAYRSSEKETLIIGKYCSIAEDVQFLCGGGHHNINSVTTYPLIYNLFNDKDSLSINGETLFLKDWDIKLYNSKGSILVGNDVWIGYHATIQSGVTIGNGAVIMAGAIVTKDVPPYSIVGGVPAKVINYRFDEATIEKIQTIAWWDWPEALIRERISDFFIDGPTFVQKYYQPNGSRSELQSKEVGL
jgi:acetyltransferase-like isoleucine patch superfamily enzyme